MSGSKRLAVLTRFLNKLWIGTGECKMARFNIAKNQKGQALLETVVMMNIFLMLFFILLLVGSYMFDRMVVVYAANVALNEGVGVAPKGLPVAEVEKRMKRKADSILTRYGIFLKNPASTARLTQVSDNPRRYHFSVITAGTYRLRLPFISDGILHNDRMAYQVGVDYSW
jgi:hypothetical protein